MKTGLLNNTNAQKGEDKKSEILNVRVTKKEKERWRQAAQEHGLSLACWVEDTLNEKCILQRAGA